MPTGASANFSLPVFLTWVGLTIIGSPQLWSVMRSHSEYGLLNVSFSVYSSTASAPVMYSTT